MEGEREGRREPEREEGRQKGAREGRREGEKEGKKNQCEHQVLSRGRSTREMFADLHFAALHFAEGRREFPRHLLIQNLLQYQEIILQD